MARSDLERVLAAQFGVPVQVTLRGPGRYTFATEAVNEEVAAGLAEMFEPGGDVSILHDAELGSFVYFDAKEMQ